MDLTDYQIPSLFQNKKAPAYRFQELIVQAIDKFKIDSRWQKMIWGLIGKNLRQNEDFTVFQLERAIRETEQRKLANPAQYFIKLLLNFLR